MKVSAGMAELGYDQNNILHERVFIDVMNNDISHLVAILVSMRVLLNTYAVV